VVIALSVDDPGALPRIKAFYRQTVIRWLGIYLDKTGRAMSDMGVAAIPTTLLIDLYGNEVGRKVGAVKWDSPALVKRIEGYVDAR